MFLILCNVLLAAALAAVCLLLILFVLMQRPRQEGLIPAIGGNITASFWGPQTASVLHKGTVWLGVLLFVLSLAFSLVRTSQARALHIDPVTSSESSQTQY